MLNLQTLAEDLGTHVRRKSMDYGYITRKHRLAVLK